MVCTKGKLSPPPPPEDTTANACTSLPLLAFHDVSCSNTAETGKDCGGGDFLPSRTGAGSMVIRCDAVVSTAAEAGAAALGDIAGGLSD